MDKEREWRLREPADPDNVAQLAAELGVDPVLATLLINRGVKTFEEARSFFRPSLSALHDPFLMKDMDKAVARLEKAISSSEKILVYGDYDVDGTTAVALVYSFIHKLNPLADFYIPDRYDEGYGVSRKGIDWAAENGFSLIITLDCGIKAIDKVEYAAGKGIDIIICDHHLPEDEIPAAAAVLDPKREDCNYPFDDLSGCGVGFKLVQAYSQIHGIDFENLLPLLDLLVVSIASDLVTVVGENRVLAHFGLKRLNEQPRVGLQAMINLPNLSMYFYVFDCYSNAFNQGKAAYVVQDMECALYLLNGGKNVPNAIDPMTAVNDNVTNGKSVGKSIAFTFFTGSFYKKGILKLKFKDSAKLLIDRLNIFVGMKRGWLPADYGTKPYDALSNAEKKVIDSFQSREEYDAVVANPDEYIIKDFDIEKLFEAR